MENAKNILEVRNLEINFNTYAGTVRAIRNVSFDLRRGETLAIVGESGSGKSVTTRAIMGLLANNAVVANGTIEYDGKDLLKQSNRQMEKIRSVDIAEIFQDPMTSLDPTMKIGKQIAEPLIVHKGVKPDKAREAALKMMEAVGITNAQERINDYPHQFSGGMRQRIVIAIALINHPDILIADEPTTALDVTIQAQILNLMRRLQNMINTSIIFITHDLGVVAGMADRVAVMYAGKIVEYGKADEIFYNPKHPYTWGLLESMPTLDTDAEYLPSIPGTPPDLLNPPVGDAFAPRNKYALEVDLKAEPPFFEVSPTHFAATWLLDPRAPQINPPEIIVQRQQKYENERQQLINADRLNHHSAEEDL
ncbi:ABC transporter ATP-binding protein [Lentilactobacillus kribbianus]|uniref:ABC transporter ATP-binding protein n=1 Tax=Lentilactobacillus kribbianus TaxID=2729622 RepID=UPI001555694C|nr:ABC transporter ATP-binding protein [Lentilactobacillus kribbianus]